MKLTKEIQTTSIHSYTQAKKIAVEYRYTTWFAQSEFFSVTEKEGMPLAIIMF
jgi:hypothetical protein